MSPIPLIRSCTLALFASAACGSGDEVDISTITNETAQQAAAEVAQETRALTSLDSVPAAVADSVNASQAKRRDFIQQALKDSPYATLSDHGVDSMRQAWLEGYARSCDPSKLKRIMDAMRSDEVLKQWCSDRVDSAAAYHGRLMRAQKNCAGS
jgi:hypothetical protein